MIDFGQDSTMLEFAATTVPILLHIKVSIYRYKYQLLVFIRSVSKTQRFIYDILLLTLTQIFFFLNLGTKGVGI